MKKLFLYLSITTAILAILPLPFAIFVDITYHWLLIVTIPAGILLASIFLIIWGIIKHRESN